MLCACTRTASTVGRRPRTKDGISDAVQQHVAIRVCLAALGVRYLEAADPQVVPLCHAVQVPAVAYTEGQLRRLCRGRCARSCAPRMPLPCMQLRRHDAVAAPVCTCCASMHQCRLCVPGRWARSTACKMGRAWLTCSLAGCINSRCALLSRGRPDVLVLSSLGSRTCTAHLTLHPVLLNASRGIYAAPAQVPLAELYAL